MQQADIRDNYPLWTSQETILKNISKSYLEHTRRKILKASPVSPGSKGQPAHQATNANLHLFPPQGPEDHLQAHQYKPKTRNIHIDSVNRILLKDKSN